VTVANTPVLSPEEARMLIDSIDITTPVSMRDRAPIGLIVFSFARISAALGMKVEDVFTQNHRLWVRLRENGGKPHAMPCRHNLETYLNAYIEGAGLVEDPNGPLFRTSRGRTVMVLSDQPMIQSDAWRMIRRRARSADDGLASAIPRRPLDGTASPWGSDHLPDPRGVDGLRQGCAEGPGRRF
jgi:integrase/recombinase XerC